MSSQELGVTRLILIVGLATIAGCSSTLPNDTTVAACPTSGVTKIEKVYGDSQSVVVGTAVDVYVYTTNSKGGPVCKLTINWAPGANSGTSSVDTSVTNDSDDEVVRGTASTTWTVGSAIGVQTLVATVANTNPALTVTFTATVFPIGTCIPVRIIPVTDSFAIGDHWTTTILSSDGTNTHTETQQSTGGNLDGFRKMTQVFGLPVGTSGTSNQTILHLFTGLQYAPGFSGPICSLTYQEDQINLGTENVGWGPAVAQGGIVYTYHPSPFFTSPIWTTRGPYELSATDFSPAGLNLTDGPAITFGYFRSGSTGLTPTQAVTSTHGIDNWMFLIHGQ